MFVDSSGVAPWYALFLDSLRATLRTRHPEVELDVESFSPTVLGAANDDGTVPDWLVQKYARRRYDIILALNPAFVRGSVAVRDRLWPSATVVAAVVGDRQLAELASAPRVTGMRPHNTMATTLSLVFRLLPNTRHVAVIAGAPEIDWRRTTWWSSLESLPAGVQVIDLSGLDIEVLRKRVVTLPKNTAVIFMIPGPVLGRTLSPSDLLSEVSQRANAPVFVEVTTMFGTGAVGGPLSSPASAAIDVAGQIDRLLGGTPPERIGIESYQPPRIQFDWRVLTRWGIPMSRLPADSEVHFEPPSLWVAYRNQLLVALGVVVVQSGLIVALLIERRRRRHAELRSREHLATLARLNRGAALGALSAALAHEINQPLGAILSNAETAELLLERDDEDSRAMLREVLAAIRDDDQRAAAVLGRLRDWIANAPGTPQPIALNPLIVEVVRMLDTELRLRETALQLTLAPELPDVVADGVQVQQVVLNLVLNALDALQQMPVRQRRLSVATRRRDAAHAEVVVQDSGPGLQGVPAGKLFEPFFTTKPQGLGVGLAISASIAERHGGALHVEEVPEGGARFAFSLQVQRGRSA